MVLAGPLIEEVVNLPPASGSILKSKQVGSQFPVAVFAGP